MRIVAVMLLGMAGVWEARVAPWPGDRGAGGMGGDVYVWQRAWNGAVREAVAGHGGTFGRVVALGAEVDFAGGRTRVTRIELSWGDLRRIGRPVGLAVRIGPYRGKFEADDPAGRMIESVARSLLSDAAKNGVAVAEIQLDFDAAESQLRGYRRWVEAARRAGPAAVTITALPSWLDAPGCGELLAATDGFVLQVHSFSRPRGIGEDFRIFDPPAAFGAVEKAARFGVPFRVALPTYGYDAVFGADGRFVAARGERTAPPRAGERVRRYAADPVALARAVRNWTHDRPAEMKGIIWYRLPVASDRLNWPWETLAAVREGRTPRADVGVEIARSRRGLVELGLVNRGEASADMARARVAVRCDMSRLLAGDALAPWGFVDRTSGGVILQSSGAGELRPGDRRAMGWLRFAGDTEVAVDVEILENHVGDDGDGAVGGGAGDGVLLHQSQ